MKVAASEESHSLSVPSREDLDGITKACMDYYAAYYTADPDRMTGCLHSSFAKRRVAYDAAPGTWKTQHIDRDTMVAATARGGGSTSVPETERWVHITMVDVSGRMASVKIVAYPFVEYVHLGKFDERWQIVNVLWDRRLVTPAPGP